MANQALHQFPFFTPKAFRSYRKLGHLRATLDAFWLRHQGPLVAEPSDEDGEVDEMDGLFVPDDIESLSWDELYDLYTIYEEIKEIVDEKADELTQILDAKEQSRKKN